jgi:hypothetical protein
MAYRSSVSSAACSTISSTTEFSKIRCQSYKALIRAAASKFTSSRIVLGVFFANKVGKLVALSGFPPHEPTAIPDVTQVRVVKEIALQNDRLDTMRQRNYRVDRAAVVPIGSWLPKLQA